MTAAGCAVYVMVAFGHDADSGDSVGEPLLASDRQSELRNACTTLGVKDFEVLRRGGIYDDLADNPARLVQQIESGAEFSLAAVRPDVIFIPARGAFHQEHEALHRACFSAARMGGIGGRWFPPCVLGCSGPEDSWTSEQFGMRLQVDISRHFEIKHAALTSYQRQMKTPYHPRSFEGIKALDHAAGVRAGVDYAEEFTVYRMTVHEEE